MQGLWYTMISATRTVDEHTHKGALLDLCHAFLVAYEFLPWNNLLRMTHLGGVSPGRGQNETLSPGVHAFSFPCHSSADVSLMVMTYSH